MITVRILSDKSPEETEERQKVKVTRLKCKDEHCRRLLIPGEIFSCLDGFDRVRAALWQLNEPYTTRLAEIIYRRVDEVTKRGDVHSALYTHPQCVSLPLFIFLKIPLNREPTTQRHCGLEQDEK